MSEQAWQTRMRALLGGDQSPAHRRWAARTAAELLPMLDREQLDAVLWELRDRPGFADRLRIAVDLFAERLEDERFARDFLPGARKLAAGLWVPGVELAWCGWYGGRAEQLSRYDMGLLAVRSGSPGAKHWHWVSMSGTFCGAEPLSRPQASTGQTATCAKCRSALYTDSRCVWARLAKPAPADAPEV